MKIIHTADWHIGKMLYKHSLNDEIELFFDWLQFFIKTEKADVLLVSGDIFDLANPSHADLTLYYRFLRSLMDTHIQVIITGGNHDSISLLNAPKDILATLNIFVVGGADEDLTRELIPLHNNEGVIEAVVLAVPFLRDRDLRQSVQADLDEDREAILPLAIQRHYDALLALAREEYGPNIPVIAMGHFFVQGATQSDSERDIYVGHLQGISRSVFSEDLAYVALGHIHKPQAMDKGRIRYSGSPVYLDFSEVNYEKGIELIHLNGQGVEDITTVNIPVFRELKRMSGTLEAVRNELAGYEKSCPLPAFIELIIETEYRDPSVLLDIENWVYEKNDQYKIIKHVIKMPTSAHASLLPEHQSETIDTLSPLEILDRRLTGETLVDDMIPRIKGVYAELVSDIQRGI